MREKEILRIRAVQVDNLRSLLGVRRIERMLNERVRVEERRRKKGLG